MRRVLAVLIVAAVAGAYFAGREPERRARIPAETALATARADLERAEARNRLYRLQSQLIDLFGTVEARNFGEAQGKATSFFDALRAEAVRRDQEHVRGALEALLADRDSLTIAINRNDPAAVEMLRGALARLRAALGETAPPPPAASPSLAPAAQ